MSPNIHLNDRAGQIQELLVQKLTTLADNDVIIIEDSEDSFIKKYVTVADLRATVFGIEVDEIFEVDATIQSTKKITLANTPTEGSLKVFYQGVLQYPGVSYSYAISGNEITFNIDTGLYLTDVILVNYRYN
jgi:hypothetical protein